MRLKSILAVLAGAFALQGASNATAAEIRLARQFSMGYLQLNVMEHQQLIEKHAKALGLNDVKVSWFTFNGPTAVNEALISGNIDVGSGGVPGLLVLWSRSKGTPQEVRGISALSSQPFLLNSRSCHQDHQGLQGHRSDCSTRGALICASDHAADGGGQRVWHQGIREA